MQGRGVELGKHRRSDGPPGVSFLGLSPRGQDRGVGLEGLVFGVRGEGLPGSESEMGEIRAGWVGCARRHSETRRAGDPKVSLLASEVGSPAQEGL